MQPVCRKAGILFVSMCESTTTPRLVFLYGGGSTECFGGRARSLSALVRSSLLQRVNRGCLRALHMESTLQRIREAILSYSAVFTTNHRRLGAGAPRSPQPSY
jgi:hypothetical protein